jgi:hypothetical protein
MLVSLASDMEFFWMKIVKRLPHLVLWYAFMQFAGGLDSETLCAFEEIRQQVPQYIGGSRELLAAIPSS